MITWREHLTKLASDPPLKRRPRPEPETRTYSITAKPHQFAAIEELLGAIQYLGRQGASRTLQIYVDGDGSARVRVVRDAGSMSSELTTKINIDPDIIKLKGLN